jgi:hypothetical protein
VIPFEQGKAPKGGIPGALSARNKAGAGPGGGNRQEGKQTLKAERSGRGKPAASGPPSPACAEGNRSPESCHLVAHAVKVAGYDREKLWRKAKLEESLDREF